MIIANDYRIMRFIKTGARHTVQFYIFITSLQ